METVMLIVAGTLVSLMIVFGVARQPQIPRRRGAGNSDGSVAVYSGSGDGCDAGDAGCSDSGGGDGGGGGGD